jgi:uncharacterized membrane protein
MFDLNTNLQFAVHGGADSGGVASMVAGLLSFVESLVRLSPTELFAELMPGISALENLHPVLVHFPIALLSLFFVFDLAGSLARKADWRRAAGWFLYAGALFSGFTVAAGLIAAASVAHGGDVHAIMENHQRLGISVLLLAVVLAVWRWLAKGDISGAANTLYQICSALLAGLLAFTADLGGLMVYQYGVAVAPVAENNKAAAEAHQHGRSAEEAVSVQVQEAVPAASDAGHDHVHNHSH